MSNELDIAAIETVLSDGDRRRIPGNNFAPPDKIEWIIRQLIATVKAQEKRIEVLNMENAHLRVIAQKIGCPYGHRNENGACKLGYPGCACMDDLLAMQAWCPEDEEKVAVRLGKRIKELVADLKDITEQHAVKAYRLCELEAELAEAKKDSERLEWVFKNQARVYKIENALISEWCIDSPLMNTIFYDEDLREAIDLARGANAQPTT